MTTLLLVCLLPAADRPPVRIDAKALHAELTKARKKYDVPALAAAVVSSKGLLAVDAVGVRKRGGKEAVTTADRFHIGSCTKAMTAALLAVLAEKKLLSWDLTLARAFPDLAGKMTAEYRAVTLGQLLRHRAGLPANQPGGWWKVSTDDPIRVQRGKVVAEVLTGKPAARPGTKYLYSNVGYVIAAALAERVAKSSWEELIAKHIFGPLKMTSAGFGPMGTKGKADQPLGHEEDGTPVEPGPKADNPPVMSPAGRVHCTLGDWARFVADQLKGARGQAGLLPAAAYRKLHEAAAGETYSAGGWISLKTPGGRLLAHDGSNTMHYATAVLLPKADLAVLVVCNQGGEKGQKACVQAREAILMRLLK